MEDAAAHLHVVERVGTGNNLPREAALPRNMTTAKKVSESKGKDKGDDKAYDKSSRCWPGFEPVPGKGEHEQGSCRKVPASKNGGKEVDRETARKKQVAEGGKRAEQAKSKSPNAAERKSVSRSAKNATPAKRAPAKKVAAKKPATAKKRSPARKTPAKRRTPAKATAQ